MKRVLLHTIFAVATAASVVFVQQATAAPASKPNPKQVLICHKPPKQGMTLQVAPSAVPGHQKHGDTTGPCPVSPSA